MADGEHDSLVHFNSFWHGGELTPLAASCLRSFVELGHAMTLYGYEPLRRVPSGVQIADAATIIPRQDLMFHRKSGRVGVFADRFRYELLARGAEAWIDCDMLCLKPVRKSSDYIFGWENPASINNAILRIPAHAGLLDDLRGIFADNWRPPWYPPLRRLRYGLKRLLIPGFDIAHMPWATTGPQALTHYCTVRGLLAQAAPQQVYYPVPMRRSGVFLEDDGNVAQYLSTDSLCIHMWNGELDTLIAKGHQPGGRSFYARVLDGSWRGALAAASDAPGE